MYATFWCSTKLKCEKPSYLNCLLYYSKLHFKIWKVYVIKICGLSMDNRIIREMQDEISIKTSQIWYCIVGYFQGT